MFRNVPGCSMFRILSTAVSYSTLQFICRIVEFNRNYMKRTKFVCDLKILERIRSSHKEFAYLLYNSTENTRNPQNLGMGIYIWVWIFSGTTQCKFPNVI